MLRTRVITAIFALVPMISIFIFGNTEIIRIFFLLLTALSAFEMAGMLFPALQKKFGGAEKESTVPTWLVIVSILLCSGLYIALTYSSVPPSAAIGLFMLGATLLGVFGARSVDLSFAYASGLVVTILYGVFPWLATVALYDKAGDSRYIFLLCTVVWCGDTGAYFAGRSFGRRKLAPRMSPNKTWEGAVGGIMGSLLGGIILKAYQGDSLFGWFPLIVSSLLGGVFGQLGDLTESTFKRFAGVKDSGKVLPGHGGFLDRVDGLLFAAPVIWFILYQFGT